MPGKHNAGGCGCCGCDCIDHLADGVTAGLGGIEADVTGTNINMSETTTTAGTCGWSISDRICEAAHTAMIRLFGPSSCPVEDPLDLGLFYGPTIYSDSVCVTGDRWASMQAAVGVNCVANSPLWQAYFSWGYSVFVRNTIYSPPFDCYDYDITADLVTAGYSLTGTNLYTYYSGDEFSGDYLAHVAQRVGTGSQERWNLTVLKAYSSADPADLVGWGVTNLEPLFNPSGDLMTGTVL